MPCTVNVNFRTVVHAGSTGIGTAFPDVCKTPAPPAPPIPIPYPNIAMSSDLTSGTSQVKVDGQPACIEGANLKMSSGDEAGVAGGVVSGCIKGKAEPMLYSFDVKFEGKGVVRLADIFIHNKGNTPPMPIVQAPLPPIVIMDDPESTNELTEIEFADDDVDEDG